MGLLASGDLLDQPGRSCGDCPYDREPVRALVIDDRASFAPVVAKRLEGLGVRARWVTHGRALALDDAAWRGLDLIVLDALDLGSQQDDPTRSRLASLDILDRVADVRSPDRPEVLVYSTAMTQPEIRIPLATHRLDPPLFDVSTLVDQFNDIVAGETGARLDPPTRSDWTSLEPSLDVESRLADAHQHMRDHDRAWRQIWDADAPFDEAAQVWIARNILPMLGLDSSRGYGIACAVIRRMAGLPYRI
jgi:CheY-like chemotaxis protein